MKAESCTVCGKPLGGRQRRFCSRACKNRDTNTRHQAYSSQQARGLARKYELILASGGKCRRCGYARNIAALTWHHVDPASKAFNLDVRSLSNRNRTVIDEELRKCILICANCHAETHFPELDMDSAHHVSGDMHSPCR